jgi:hypothetical protein
MWSTLEQAIDEIYDPKQHTCSKNERLWSWDEKKIDDISDASTHEDE